MRRVLLSLTVLSLASLGLAQPAPPSDDRAAARASGEVEALNELATAQEQSGEPEKALAIYEQSLATARRSGDRTGEAITLNRLALLHSLQPNGRDRALAEYRQALTILRELGDPGREAYVLSNIGDEFIQTAEDKPKAIEYYLQALPLMRAAGNRAGEHEMLTNIGLVYSSLSETRKALEYFSLALPILRELGDREGEATILYYIGGSYVQLGDYQRGLEIYRQTLALSRAAGSQELEEPTLNRIGTTYHLLGDLQAAEDYIGRARELVKNPMDDASYLDNLGSIALARGDRGDREKALESFRKALAILEGGNEPRALAAVLAHLGNVHREMGEPQKALDFYARALELKRQIGDRHNEGYILGEVGQVHLLQGATHKALEDYRRAHELGLALGDRRLEAKALSGLGRASLQAGDLDEARQRLASALEVLELLRGRIGSQELRSAFFGTVRQTYETYIDVLMRMHRRDPAAGLDAAALQASERARARGMLDLLTEARADLRQGVDPKLLARERAVLEALNEAAERQTRLLVGKPAEAELTALRREIAELTSEHQEVSARIRESNPRYAALTQPAALTAAEIQREILDPETLLLEYALGDEHSYLWAVTPTSLRSFELPGRERIESATRRVYELLTARNRRVRFETAEERRARVAADDAEYPGAAAELSRLLLGPVAADLGTKRLLIVGDGALGYLPFAALPEPSRTEEPLIVRHEIVSLPSASTLAVQRRSLAGRQPAAKTLAVLADPVFDRGDERLAAATQPGPARGAADAPEATRDLLRSAAESGLAEQSASIPRLPYTRQEANDILALVPRAESLRALDFDASHATATSAGLGQYRYVHFATHGLLNSLHPELSGLVLSLVDRNGAEQNGFLRLNEIFNLHLPAEMVVLSGCRTGLGKEIRGEGLVGLTHGFLYAGAARVLVSLWDISDRASAELMAHLYREMLGNGLRPSAALRAAQLRALKQEKWRAPYYWAAFELQGEPR